MHVLKTACVGSRPFDFDVNLGQYLEHERKLLDIIRKARETG
jgi:methyl coenzyme M reductase subunit D